MADFTFSSFICDSEMPFFAF